MFREEFTNLELGRLNWLSSILQEAYRLSVDEAVRSEQHADSLREAVDRVQKEIAYRISGNGGDAELRRLQELAAAAPDDSDHIQDMFEFLSEETRLIYRAAACRTTTLMIEWANAHPSARGYPAYDHDPYHVNAETRLQGEHAHVELQVHLDDFEHKSLLAVPALLTHELVCHAHSREDKNSNLSWWAEGVMDWVACHFSDVWSVRLELPYEVLQIHSARLRGARMTRVREDGHLAVAALIAWLADDTGVRDPHYLKVLATSLALQVNAFHAPLRAKDYFATRLPGVRRDKTLQEALRSWFGGDGSIGDLLR